MKEDKTNKQQNTYENRYSFEENYNNIIIGLKELQRKRSGKTTVWFSIIIAIACASLSLLLFLAELIL